MSRKLNIFVRMILLVLSVGLTACSCGQREKSPDVILSELMGEEGSFPKGEIYRSGAEEGGEGYPPSALLRALYGEESEEDIRICEYAIYLSSFAVPLEIAVFRAPSGDHAMRLYTLCLSRADLLKVALRNTEYLSLGEEIVVFRSDRYVVMGVTYDRESFLKAVKSEIG